MLSVRFFEHKIKVDKYSILNVANSVKKKYRIFKYCSLEFLVLKNSLIKEFIIMYATKEAVYYLKYKHEKTKYVVVLIN